MMIQDFTRVINPIKIKIGQRYANVFIEIEYKDGKLSLHGVEGPLQSGNCRGSCGQIDMGYRGEKQDIVFNKGWNRGKWNKLLYIWKNYHLNDMHAGTPAQEDALNKKFGGPDANRYSEQVEYLKSINLYEDNGYRYGSGWLSRPVPEEVLQWLQNLQNTTTPYAWV